MNSSDEPQIINGDGDWRSYLPPGSRERIIDKILDTLKKHQPFSGLEGLQELKDFSERIEETIYSTATSQSDYLRKLSIKMLTMESKSQIALRRTPPDSASDNRNPQDLVDLNNSPQADQPSPQINDGDWRTTLPPDARQRIVNEIMDSLKRHTPYSSVEGLRELKAIAERSEEQIYTVATSQPDYQRKISLELLAMESKSQNALPNMPLDSAGANRNPRNPDLNHPPQPEADQPSSEIGLADWRAALPTDCRQKIVNKMVDTLKRHLPFSGVEGLQEVKDIAEKFEEKIYSTAASHSDYLRTISKKMLKVESGTLECTRSFEENNAEVNQFNWKLSSR